MSDCSSSRAGDQTNGRVGRVDGKLSLSVCIGGEYCVGSWLVLVSNVADINGVNDGSCWVSVALLFAGGMGSSLVVVCSATQLCSSVAVCHFRQVAAMIMVAGVPDDKEVWDWS